MTSLAIVPPLALLCLGQSLAALLKGNAAPLEVHASNLRRLWFERAQIAATRRTIRSRAVLGDLALFRHAVRSQTRSYYWGLVKRG